MLLCYNKTPYTATVIPDHFIDTQYNIIDTI